MDLAGIFDFQPHFLHFGTVESHRFYCVRFFERIMVVDGGGGQDAAIYARYFLALQVKRDVLRIVEVYVCQRDVDQTVFIFEADALSIGTSRLSRTRALSQIRSIGRNVAS